MDRLYWCTWLLLVATAWISIMFMHNVNDSDASRPTMHDMIMIDNITR